MTEDGLRRVVRDTSHDAYLAGWRCRHDDLPFDPRAAEDNAELHVMPVAADLVQEALEEGFQQARVPAAVTVAPAVSQMPVFVRAIVILFGILLCWTVISLLALFAARATV